MAQRRSRAREAAAALRGGAAERVWTKSMVERAVATFNDIDRIPPFEEDAIRRAVRDFLRFEKRVLADGVAAETTPLAQRCIDYVYTWLDAHPDYIPFRTPQWTLQMVEEMVSWFADATSTPPDRRRAQEIAERLKAFQHVVTNESIEAGDAATLAHAFLDHALHWMQRHPDVRAAFDT
jgi:hypothetical protein